MSFDPPPPSPQVWSHHDYPLIPVGKMVLDRNPVNYFAEVEQSAYCPSNFVPGIEASPDKMLQVRATVMQCILVLLVGNVV